MAEPYDRLIEYLSPGDYIRFTTKYGKSKWIVIESSEPMGQIPIQLSNIVVFVPARAARAGAGTVVPAGQALDADPVALDFLEPQREDRFYQIRPTVFAISRAVLTNQELVDEASIPPLVEFEWEFPSGTPQGGTDMPSDVTINGCINRNVGGPTGGRIPANMIYTKTDPNPVFDIFAFYKTFPAFRMINRTRGIVGGGGGAELDFDWYLAMQGMKYIFRLATSDEEEKLNNKELPYRSIPSPGGVPETLISK